MRRAELFPSPDSSPSHRPDCFSDVLKACSFSCPVQEADFGQYKGLEHIGTMVLYKETYHALIPWPHPSIHSDFKLGLKCLRNSGGKQTLNVTLIHF